MIPESFIEELKYRSSIEEVIAPYTQLKRAGRSLKGLCPFHSEKSASFTVYPENGSFYCFGCGVGGDVVTFVKMVEHLEYIEALRFLAVKAGMTLPEDVQDDQTAKLRTRILEVNRETARFFHSVLTSPQGEAGLNYFRNRGLSDKTIKRFGLGYSPDSWDSLLKHLTQKGFTQGELSAAAVVREVKDKNRCYDIFRGRAMFPIIDLRGGVIGFGGRIIGEGQPKYLNSSDTLVFKKSRGLFALNLAKASKEPRLLLTEGYMDAIAVHQAGMDNGVATLGTALTSEQARLMASYTSEVVVAYDSDVAGQKATVRATELLSQVGIKVRVLSMKGSKDPDEYIKAHGAVVFKQLVEGSANSTEYRLSNLKQRFDLDADDGKVEFLKEFCQQIAELQNRIEADVYINRIANELSLPREAIAEQIASIRERKRKSREKKQDASLTVYAQENPSRQKDVMRSQNLRYALAEDKLLVLLMKNPDYFEEIAKSITPSQIVTDSNREIFQALWERLENGKTADITALSATLSNQQMSRLAGMIASNCEGTTTRREAKDYISTILSKERDKSDEQIGSMDEEQLKEFIGGLAAAKK